VNLTPVQLRDLAKRTDRKVERDPSGPDAERLRVLARALRLRASEREAQAAINEPAGPSMAWLMSEMPERAA